jgi:hypothetical protein
MLDKRQEGVVKTVFYGLEDHGILTCSLGIEFDGMHQGFGGLHLDETTTGPLFKQAICDFFDRPFDSIVGTPVIGLWCFGRLNEPIEGLELPSGRRFTISGWQRKHNPKALSPFARTWQRHVSEIAFLERRLKEERQALDELEKNYTDWGLGT